MKKLALLPVVMLMLGGCIIPSKPADSRGVLFQQSLDKTRGAAVDALTVHGFNIRKQESHYVEGLRPIKFGLIVGSGGEGVGIWLESLHQERTRVLVKVKGHSAQSWEEKILQEMEKVLQ